VIDHQIAGTTVVALNGEFDVTQRERLDDACAAALGSSLVVLDLEHTLYLDSTVLSCLMRLHNTMLERDGQLVLVRVPHIVHRLLESCGLTRLLDVRETMGDIETERLARGGGLRRIELIAGSDG
jgi:anti-anti-sigma factor